MLSKGERISFSISNGCMVNLSNYMNYFLKYLNKISIIKKKAYFFFLLFILFIYQSNKINLNKKFKNEILFLKSCLDNTSIEFFEQYENPKLSIVIPLYNNEKYLNRLLRSIQKQKIKEIEIIFVDDASNDNSFKIIENYKNIDKRIKILRNLQNKGSLYTYVRCILEAKANYTMILDADDMLLSNLKELYEISLKNDKDINDFGYIYGNIDNFIEIKMGNRELNQPYIGEMFFSNRYHGCTYITKKIMKSEMLKNAVKSLKGEYLNSKIILHADTIIFICIFYYSKSYKSFNRLFSQIYMLNNESTSNNILKNYNELFRVSIYLVKYILELNYNSKKYYNHHIEKIISILNWPINLCGNRKLYVDWDLLNEVINKILNNKDLYNNNKNDIYKLLNLIKEKNNNI